MENENKKLGSEPAMPFEADYQMDKNRNTPQLYEQSKGMSKRFYASCAAKDDFDEYCRPLQEAIVGRQAPNLTTEPLLYMEWLAEGIAKWKYMKADALLKQENE